MGGASSAGAVGVANFKHFILNNGVHNSVGGMPTAGLRVSFTETVKACGYTDAWHVEWSEELAEMVARLRSARGPAMLEIMVRKGGRSDLGQLSPGSYQTSIDAVFAASYFLHKSEMAPNTLFLLSDSIRNLH